MPGFRPAGSVWLRQETPACAEDTVCGIEIILLRCPLRRQGSISGLLPMHMRQLQEMDTCLRRYLRGEGLVSNPSENSLPHTKHLPSQEPDQVPFWLWVAGSGWCGSERRSDARLGRSGQGEPVKAGWAFPPRWAYGGLPPKWISRVKSPDAPFAVRSLRRPGTLGYVEHIPPKLLTGAAGGNAPFRSLYSL